MLANLEKSKAETAAQQPKEDPAIAYNRQLLSKYENALNALTNEVADLYGGTQFLPEIFYIDRNGKIVEHAVGLKGRGEIEDNIKKALGNQ